MSPEIFRLEILLCLYDLNYIATWSFGDYQVCGKLFHVLDSGRREDSRTNIFSLIIMFIEVVFVIIVIVSRLKNLIWDIFFFF